MDQFANNLNTMLDEQGVDEPAAEPAAAEPAAAEPAAAEPAAAEPAPATDAADEAPKVRKIEGPAAEPVDLAAFGPTMAKQLAPIVALVLIVLLILRARR